MPRHIELATSGLRTVSDVPSGQRGFQPAGSQRGLSDVAGSKRGLILKATPILPMPTLLEEDNAADFATGTLRAVEVAGNVGNVMTNPYFDTASLTYWSGYWESTRAIDTSKFHGPPQSMKVHTGGIHSTQGAFWQPTSGAQFLLLANQNFMVGCWVWAPVGMPITMSGRLSTAAGVYLTENVAPVLHTGNGAWQWMTFGPATRSDQSFLVGFQLVTTWLNNDFWVDGVVVIPNSSAPITYVAPALRWKQPRFVLVRGGNDHNATMHTRLNALGFTDTWFAIGATNLAELQDATKRSVSLPAIAANYISTPDSVANSITGPITICMRVAPYTWTPTVQSFFMGKEVAPSSRSYCAGLGSSPGRPIFRYSTDGTAVLQDAATASPVIAAGMPLWLKYEHDTVTGITKFWTAPDQNIADPASLPWVQLGSDVAGTAGALFNSTVNVEIGSRNGGGTEMMPGRYFYVDIRSGIGPGTIVAKWDPSAVIPSSLLVPSSLVSSTGETWTFNGTKWGWSNPPYDMIIEDSTAWGTDKSVLMKAAYQDGMGVLTSGNDNTVGGYPQISTGVPNGKFSAQPPYRLEPTANHPVSAGLPNEDRETDTGQLPLTIRAGAVALATMPIGAENKLTTSQATMSPDIVGWSNGNNTGTLTRVSGIPNAQSGWVLGIPANAAGNTTAFQTYAQAIPCTPGQAVMGTVEFRAATVLRLVSCELRFYTGDGSTFVDTIGAGANDSTTAWTGRAVAQAVAPAGTVAVGLICRVTANGGAGETHYIHKAAIQFGTAPSPSWPAAAWIAPGANPFFWTGIPAWLEEEPVNKDGRWVHLHPYSTSGSYGVGTAWMQIVKRGSAWAAPTYRTTSMSIDDVGIIGSSQVTWTATTPGESFAQVEASLDQVTWLPVTNGGPIPGLDVGGSGAGITVYFRQRLVTYDPAVIPTLNTFKAVVWPQVALGDMPGSYDLSLSSSGKRSLVEA